VSHDVVARMRNLAQVMGEGVSRAARPRNFRRAEPGMIGSPGIAGGLQAPVPARPSANSGVHPGASPVVFGKPTVCVHLHIPDHLHPILAEAC
jgi:hypothetical protein